MKLQKENVIYDYEDADKIAELKKEGYKEVKPKASKKEDAPKESKKKEDDGEDKK